MRRNQRPLLLRRSRKRRSRAGVPTRRGMTDHRFFDRAGPYSLDELAELSGARLWGEADGKQVFSDVAPLETAGPEDVAFLDNRKYVEAFVHSRAGAAFIDERFAERAPAG